MRRKAELTVTEAAKIFGVDPQQIRYGMRQNRLPIGWCVQNEKGNWAYHIVVAKFCKFFRMTKEELYSKLEEIRKA